MKLFKKITAIILVVAALTSLSACSLGDVSWVYDYDGKKIQPGVHIALTMSAYYEAMNMREDKEKDLFKQEIEGKAAKDWIVEKALKDENKLVAIENKFDELGLTLAEDDIAVVDNLTEYQWAGIGTTYENNGVSKESYRRIAESTIKTNLIYKKYYGEGGLEEVTEEELKKVFENDYAYINLLDMTFSSAFDEEEQAAVDEANKELEVSAAAYVEVLNEGERTFGEIADEYEHSLYATEHNSEDPEDVIREDDETKAYVRRGTEDLPEKTMSMIFDEMKADGTAKLSVEENACLVIVRYPLDMTKFDEMKDTILDTLKGDDFDAMVEEWAAAVKPSATNDNAVKHYNPKNIKLD